MSSRMERHRSRGLLRRWWLILPLTIVGVGVGYAVNSSIEPVYQARGSILVGRSLHDPNVSQEDIETSTQLAATYADIAQRRPVLEAAADQVDLGISWETLADRVDAQVSRDDGQVIVITVNAPAAEEAVLLADELIGQIIAISPTDAEGTTPQATTPAAPERFIETRLQSIEQDIARLEQRNDSLRRKLDRVEGPRVTRVQLRISANEALILDLQQSYSALLQFVETSQVSNHLEVLEQPQAVPEPVWPRQPLSLAVGGAAGLLLGLAIASILERRGGGRGPDTSTMFLESRPSEVDTDQGSSTRPRESAGDVYVAQGYDGEHMAPIPSPPPSQRDA